MAVTVGEFAILGVALVTLAVAALVLFLDFSQRVHRAFALFLVLRAMMDGLLIISQDEGLGYRLRTYWLIAVPFAALHFCLAYRRRHGREPRQRPAWVGPLAILVVVVALEILYLLDHGLYGTPDDPGPLLSFESLRFLAYAGVSWVFAAEYQATASPGGRRALLLASVGFALTPLYYCSFELVLRMTTSTVAWSLAEGYWLLSLLLVADASRRLLSRQRPRTRTAIAATFGGSLVGAGATAWAFGSLPLLPAQTVLQVLFALSALAVPICITYALVKHRLFDIEVRLRFAIRGTTLAGLFLAAFFVVAQLAQNFLTDSLGWAVGGVTAGLLLFALNPLQKLADRIATKAVPTVPSGLAATERLQLYREQLEIAWRDGKLTAKERLLFAQLQERLGIAAADAARLENEVLQALELPGGRRKRATPA